MRLPRCAGKKNIFLIRRPQFTPKHCKPEEFYDALKYDIGTAAASLSVTKKITKRVMDIGAFLKPKKIVLGDVHYEPSYSTKSIPFENHLENYLVNNWPIFDKRGYKGIVFLFDEFHLVYDTAQKYSVLADFIGTINELQNKSIPYYLVLAGLPKLQLNVKNARSYSERMFRTVVLENLSRTYAIKAMRIPLKNFHYRFEKKLIDALVNDTGRYPYFIQFYCKEIIDETNKKNITMKDYGRVRPIIIKQLETSFFDPRIENISIKERELLIAISKITTPDIQFADIADISGMKKHALSRPLGILEKKGLILNHKRGTYRLAVPMLRDYLLRKYCRK